MGAQPRARGAEPEGGATAFHPDEGTTHPEPHAYTLLYDLLLQPAGHCLRRMREIGLRAGGPRSAATRSAPPSRTVRLNGAALLHSRGDPGLRHVSSSVISAFAYAGRFGVHAELQRAAGRSTLRLIIIEGGHASFCQLLASMVLFLHLAPAGLHIIEDPHSP